jgi:hypothetical protein
VLDPMAIMLLVAAGVYFALGDRRDAIVMLGSDRIVRVGPEPRRP